ncbi:hypothetical protein DCMF_07415 [Candidatus Formimonas warabiya]|uniref:FAD-binding PCMH-type domain-containing protein n=2 Tax=Formimonas warabiya TaxID=1761012 RepID=A0A3G1KQ86_FORW1|nr:hypothetical protein DCMF_07415 [Candidatus Formimonas warabiya]
MLPSAFEIKNPKTLSDALEILQDGKDQIQILAGGTDVLPRLKNGFIHPKMIMDLTMLKSELSQINVENGILKIGAFVTHTQICQSTVVNNTVPVLAQACQTIGCRQIRNRGTIGGNIVNASPAGDTLPVLLALDAVVQIISRAKTRELPLDDLLLGPGKVSLGSDEMISEIRIPVKSSIMKGMFKKLGTRNALNIAIASAAVVLDSCGNKRIAYGALAPRPIRAREVEEALNQNQNLLWEDVKTIIFRTVHPISDVRASADYRKEMAANLTYMCLADLGVL